MLTRVHLSRDRRHGRKGCATIVDSNLASDEKFGSPPHISKALIIMVAPISEEYECVRSPGCENAPGSGSTPLLGGRILPYSGGRTLLLLDGRTLLLLEGRTLLLLGRADTALIRRADPALKSGLPTQHLVRGSGGLPPGGKEKKLQRRNCAESKRLLAASVSVLKNARFFNPLLALRGPLGPSLSALPLTLCLESRPQWSSSRHKRVEGVWLS